MAPQLRPTFVGIGVPRAGTTWLHEFVHSHPHAYTTRSRKEVHYFDREYARGADWYLKFFAESTSDHVARGEFTPHYFYNPECIKRIKDFGIKEVVLTLRDPVDRVWSNYQFKRKQDGFEGSIDQFIGSYPEMMSWSNYAIHIGPWLDAFGDNLCVLVYEEISKDYQMLARKLGALLDISPDLFLNAVGTQRVNAGFIPKRKMLFRMTLKLNRWLMDRDLDVVANSLKSVPGIMSYLRKPDLAANLDLKHDDDRILRLTEMFLPSVAELQNTIDIDISMWKSAM